MSNNNLKTRLYPSRIDFSAETRQEIAAILNATLATTLDLKTQVKQAHWNVKGMNFYSLHLLFDEMAGELEGYVDLVAERITALGGFAMGTARVAATDSILPEYPFDIQEGQDHVTALADRFAMYAKHVREAIDQTGGLGDADTADLYTEISRTVDMRLWFLEAHLQGSDSSVTNGSSSATTKATANVK
ncbi:DNA starvation/stationary phase protection protein Dps [Limnoraphis robusta Tam1]|uniref:DNA starvation/stationary phase protection protein Dps n=1 Tax=Limnoraphis robusta TaxID=1118279 RepID=UPI002B1F93BF|nr:DNA starvation/stationary phase protection protein Dps [Limnoraphis robusta]MEA5495634.1 DNA starvation/stationary phase protection protein Dps [Limnoraphis robusta BA-68 BA1]MEA5538778.1 DNA starvation/stationary phase protection protein Dps [Limnoraphis robusta Tam1]